MKPEIFYISLAIFLTIMEMIFIPVAKRFDIQAKVSPRSSHKEKTVTGGGFIFYLSVLACYIFMRDLLPSNINMLLGCGGVLFLISLVDDVHELSPWLRLVCHVIIFSILFYPTLTDGYPHIFLVLLICGVGFVNGFNFMDGINGMMGLYSVVTLATIYFMFHTSCHTALIACYEPMILALLVASVVFCIFNFRKKALCFSGDVGSIVLGFFIAVFVAYFIVTTAEASVIVILIVYAVDTSLTIVQRLFMGENILTPHKLHLYQVLANKRGMEQRLISVYYAAVQIVINIGYFLTAKEFRWSYAIMVSLIVATVYFILKSGVVKRRDGENRKAR